MVEMPGTMLQNIQIERLPESIEAFVALRDQIAHTPQGGAAMMVLALLLYAGDDMLGKQCLTVAVDRKQLMEGLAGYRGWQLRRTDMQRIQRQIARQTYLPKTYIKGSTPESGYALGEAPYEVEFAPNPNGGELGDGRYKLFVRCSGASSPRPVTLKKNKRGLWKAAEWSSLVVGVMAVDEVIDDL